MDRRFLLAILLTAVVVLTVPRLFPTPPRPDRPSATATARTPTGDSASVAASVGSQPAAEVPSAQAQAGPVDSVEMAVPVTADTIHLETALARYVFSTAGAKPLQVELLQYESLVDSALADSGHKVRLARENTPLLRYAVAIRGDTVPLDGIAFSADTTAPNAVTFRGALPSGDSVRVQYELGADSYVIDVRGQVEGAGGSQLLVTIVNGLRTEEPDSLDDIRYYAYVVKPVLDDARSVSFQDLDTARAQVETDGPYRWVATKNKYFVLGLLTDSSAQGFSGARLVPTPRAKRDVARDAAATISYALPDDGSFSFETYAGPQQYKRLTELGREFTNVNPYGGFFAGMIQPFATAVMKLLLWMHDALKLSYGWVLIVFGIAVRVVLWPLNQTAMRTQLKLQALQPEMKVIQTQYKTDMQRQQQEIMLLYKKHGMSPATPIMGCLPMLIPLPFLFALFFVFQNTIEFRGVSFWYLSDISQKDPYYILPTVMAGSMFLLSWIGLKAAPPNPQAKILAYLMPAVLFIVLRNMAAGLNLYYAVQNMAAIPQQWLIARERKKVMPKP
ncbi:MAG TPA: membrane protein insertase YidC [Gemmatimonadaceae bacterium]|nr:membrane protein insertase YidC [Gemmatimonadaceae bacterium]